MSACVRTMATSLAAVLFLATGCTQDSKESQPDATATPTSTASPTASLSPSPTAPSLVPPPGLGEQRPRTAMFRSEGWQELMSAGTQMPFVVNGRGDALTYWYEGDPNAPHPDSSPSCARPWQQAWQWEDRDGRRATWVSAANFYAQPMLRGFLLIGLCHAKGLSNGDMAWHYIDKTGHRRLLSWVHEAATPTTYRSIVICRPPDGSEFRHCVFDEEQLTVALADELDRNYHIEAITQAGRIWAQHLPSGSASWSDDGGLTWISHRPRVGPDPTFRAGGHTAWFNDIALSRRVELSVDNGVTWALVRLPFSLGIYDATVTARGSVLAFTRDGTLMRRAPGPSNDFEPSEYDGPPGVMTVLGTALTITGTTDGSTWISQDDGRTWARVT